MRDDRATMTRLRDPDFMKDWIDALRGALGNLGFEDAHDETKLPDEKVDITYFAAIQRLIPPRRRTVHEAAVLVVPTQLQSGFDMAKKRIEAGDDLKPHMSRFTRQAIFKDRMLNDWGIQHLHLGTTLEPDGFMNRTGPVLFGRFHDDDAYLIAVLAHGAWTQLDLLETILHEWPAVLAPHQCVDLPAGPKSPTPEEIRQLRGAGVQALVTLSDGNVYGPLGGGLASDGTSARAVSRAAHWRCRVRDLQRHCKESFASLCAESVANAGIELPDEVSLRLVIRDDGLAVLVEEAMLLWRFAND